MKIQSYKYIIGSTDDFNSADALFCAYNEGTLKEYNASVFSYDAPSEGLAGFKDLEIAALIGYGLAFENGWAMDDTVSHLMVG